MSGSKERYVWCIRALYLQVNLNEHLEHLEHSEHIHSKSTSNKYINPKSNRHVENIDML